jgi:hypothetical protein
MDNSKPSVLVPRALILESSRYLAHLLQNSPSTGFLFEPIRLNSFRTTQQLLDSLNAQRTWTDDQFALRSDTGEIISVIGLDANLVVPQGAVGARRELCLGLRLLEWLRTNFLVTTPVVLWSFFSSEMLRAIGPPIVRYGRGVVHLRLPASVDQFRGAFASAIKTENLLTMQELERAVASLYTGGAGTPSLSISSQLNKDARRAVSDIVTAYAEVREPLASAMRGLKAGDADQLTSLLAGTHWGKFLDAANNLRRRLGQENARVDEPKQIIKRAVSIQSFHTWWGNNRGAEPTRLAEVADFYLQSSVVLNNCLEALKAHLPDESKRISE